MNKHVIVKLLDGESVIGELVGASEYSITIKRPIQLKIIRHMREGQEVEEPLVSIYCQFSYDEEFEFKNSMVVYCKELIERIVPFYIKTSNSLYEVEITNVVVKDYDPKEDSTTFTISEFDVSKIVH